MVNVADVEASARFWNSLGLPTVYDQALREPALSRLVGIPEDTASRVAFLGSNQTARIELIHHAGERIPTVAARLGQRPGRAVGLCLWIVQSSDFEKTLTAAQLHGGQLASGPIDVDNPIHGRRRVATVLTPEETLVEVWDGE